MRKQKFLPSVIALVEMKGKWIKFQKETEDGRYMKQQLLFNPTQQN